MRNSHGCSELHDETLRAQSQVCRVILGWLRMPKQDFYPAVHALQFLMLYESVEEISLHFLSRACAE